MLTQEHSKKSYISVECLVVEVGAVEDPNIVPTGLNFSLPTLCTLWSVFLCHQSIYTNCLEDLPVYSRSQYKATVGFYIGC